MDALDWVFDCGQSSALPVPRLGGLVALLLRAQRLLSLLGYTVRAAGSPESALGLVTSRPSDIHLVITDKVIH